MFSESKFIYFVLLAILNEKQDDFTGNFQELKCGSLDV